MKRTVDESRRLFVDCVMSDEGTFTQLRLGKDPGPEIMLELQEIMREVYWDWKDKEGLPFDIAGCAATILNFSTEAERNLQNAGNVRSELVTREIPKLYYLAFDILLGPAAAPVQSKPPPGR